MTALMTATHAEEQSKELALSSTVSLAVSAPAEPVERTGKILLAHTIATMDEIEAESWAGPVRAKEDTWETMNKLRAEREGFLNATRGKTATASRLQRTA